MKLDNECLAYFDEWIMRRFDAEDELKDGVISNPANLDFDPSADLPHDPAPPSSAWIERVLPDANCMVVIQLVLNE